MSRPSPKGAAGRGKITIGISSGTLVEKTLRFVEGELPLWRDDPDRKAETSEEALNGQLVEYLNAVGGERFPMVFFHHEKRQTENRRVDFSANPRKAQFVGERYHTKYDPLVVFEGKRLPPPKNDSSREREYLTGGAKKSGGIQRFRLSLHGAQHEVAALIGYIQHGRPRDWFTRINGWITDLSGQFPFGGERWQASDELGSFFEDAIRGTASMRSRHSRTGTAVSKRIRLHHFWVVMNSPPFASKRGI